MNGQSSQLLQYLIPMLIIVLVVRRNLRSRQLRVERLWVTPVLIFAAVAFSLASKPPTSMIAYVALPVLFALGCVAGWFRGRFTTITVDPVTHDLTSKASVVGVVLIAALFVVRYGLRFYLDQNAGALHGDLGGLAEALTDGLLLFTVGMMGTQRVEMWIRARRLLAEAIAGKTARIVS